MPRDIVRTDRAAAPPPTYSQAVKAGGLIFVSGTAPADPAIAHLIRLTLDLMNGLPSIIIGLFVFGLLVNHKQQSGLAASVALAIIMVPLIARGSQGVLLLVPGNLREAADALGITSNPPSASDERRHHRARLRAADVGMGRRCAPHRP